MICVACFQRDAVGCGNFCSSCWRERFGLHKRRRRLRLKFQRAMTRKSRQIRRLQWG